MKFTKYILSILFAILFSKFSYAVNNLESIYNHTSTIENYTGVMNTAPQGVEVNSFGIGYSGTSKGLQGFLDYGTVYKNSWFYELKLLAQYNNVTEVTTFPKVNTNNVFNPPGAEMSLSVGYNFHPYDGVNVSPYLAVDMNFDMYNSYWDSKGNSINSFGIGIFKGTYISFTTSSELTPYVLFDGGLQYLNLYGNYGSLGGVNASGGIYQFVVRSGFGLAYKVHSKMYITPYVEIDYVSNIANLQAQNSYANGGFNLNSITENYQIIGLRYSYAW